MTWMAKDINQISYTRWSLLVKMGGLVQKGGLVQTWFSPIDLNFRFLYLSFLYSDSINK